MGVSKRGAIIKLQKEAPEPHSPKPSPSGRHSTREVYRPAAKVDAVTPSRGTARRTRLQVLPAITKDRRGMATDYSCRLATNTIARIKLSRRGKTHYWIDWVFVPAAYREYGLGRKLMRKVLEDADAHGIRISPEARACAGLGQEKLEGWYFSMGFVKTPFRATFGPILVRVPRRQTRRRKAA